jgi:hypothetical protein
VISDDATTLSILNEWPRVIGVTLAGQTRAHQCPPDVDDVGFVNQQIVGIHVAGIQGTHGQARALQGDRLRVAAVHEFRARGNCHIGVPRGIDHDIGQDDASSRRRRHDGARHATVLEIGATAQHPAPDRPPGLANLATEPFHLVLCVVRLVGERNLAGEAQVLTMVGTPDQPHGAHSAQPLLVLGDQHTRSLPRRRDCGTGTGSASTDHDNIDLIQNGHGRFRRRDRSPRLIGRPQAGQDLTHVAGAERPLRRAA